MGLGTLAELRTAVLGPRAGDATAVAWFADEILPLAEQRIFYGDGTVQPLRVLDMETSDDLAFTDGEAELPEDFLDKRAIYWTGTGGRSVSLGYEPPSVFYPEEYNRRSGPWPVAYTIEGNAVKIAPGLTGDAKILYYARPDAMEEDGDTNVILAKWPGVYLFSCQMSLFIKLRDDGEIQKSRQFYADAVDAANRYTVGARSFGGPLRKRVGFGV